MLTDIRALADRFLIALPNINTREASVGPSVAGRRRIHSLWRRHDGGSGCVRVRVPAG